MAAPARSEPAQARSEPIQLHFRTVHRIEIIAGDAGDDRYETTLTEMAEACRQREDFNAWLGQFQDFLARSHAWCDDHRDVIAAAYVTSGDEGLKVFVMTTAEEYQFEFDDTITDFELELSRKFPMCPVELLQMPVASPDALRSFFAPERALQIYGQPTAARGQG